PTLLPYTTLFRSSCPKPVARKAPSAKPALTTPIVPKPISGVMTPKPARSPPTAPRTAVNTKACALVGVSAVDSARASAITLSRKRMSSVQPLDVNGLDGLVAPALVEPPDALALEPVVGGEGDRRHAAPLRPRLEIVHQHQRRPARTM